MTERPGPERIITVGRLTVRIAERLQATDEFKDLWVEGEVSERSVSAAGHVYFTLRDNAGQIRCILFATQAANVALTPQNGARLLAHGYVEVYPRDGRYQLRCDDLLPAGAGDAHLRLEALKRRLQAEGLFETARKRPLPASVRRLGVVTSAAGAAWRDIQTVVARRDPRVELILASALVQGPDAAASLVAALDGLAQLRDLDVIVIARGGGASEDLWPFNDEALVRAIARSARPVVSGVGHEVDITLTDLVADVRAPTPSVAAELVVADAAAHVAVADRLRKRIESRLRDAIGQRRRRLVAAKRLLDRRAPLARVAGLRQRLDDSRRRIDRGIARAVPSRRDRAVAAKRRIDGLSPLAVLGRGYAIVEGADGRIRTDAGRLAPGEGVRIRMRDGRAGARVTSVEASKGPT
ncbi:MAG: exodeoxyribonuclease VII large subunit [Chloroflexi bacterium]|nr:exodeoxyribonuclease VII large subunit [Chloroflexota bacterium]